MFLAVKEKIHFLVSLPALSNQDRELHKEAVLSASEHQRAGSSCLLSAITAACSRGDVEWREGITLRAALSIKTNLQRLQMCLLHLFVLYNL